MANECIVRHSIELQLLEHVKIVHLNEKVLLALFDDLKDSRGKHVPPQLD